LTSHQWIVGWDGGISGIGFRTMDTKELNPTKKIAMPITNLNESCMWLSGCLLAMGRISKQIFILPQCMICYDF
jgi:hypothetical protein